MDILVKSFNRPYYLERCLRSIELQIQGDHQVKVLDDGTPAPYLDRIQALFPNVQILKSPEYAQKAQAIAEAAAGSKPFSAFSIPTHFWIENVQQATDTFFLFEDDFWMTRPVLLSEVASLMVKENLLLLKTYWGQNNLLMRGGKRSLTDNIEQYIPKIPFLVDFLFHNRLKSQSILYHLKLFTVTNRFVISIYDLYSVASAFYRKDYWLFLWQNAAPGRVNETLQLLQATQWKRDRTGGYARFKQDASNTSYITSATNTYPDVDLDIFRFNHLMNEAWLKGGFDAMEGYPADIPLTTFEKVLTDAKDPGASPSEWLKWVSRFRDQYAGFGYTVA